MTEKSSWPFNSEELAGRVLLDILDTHSLAFARLAPELTILQVSDDFCSKLKIEPEHVVGLAFSEEVL